MNPQAVSDDFGLVQLPNEGQQRRINVLVVSSVALAFISFWRAAAIVLCDLASTAYYIGGISEQAIGKAAPWFIFGVMLFSYAVRAVYVESCTMFTRGGVYKVVKEAMGGSLAKLSVSALMFDYVLTGPISAVSAGQYIVGLGFQLVNYVRSTPIDFTTAHWQSIGNTLTVLISIAITVYFWRLNIKGIHESSDKALRIMQLTTVMAVIILAWSGLTLIVHPEHLQMPPFHPVFTGSSQDPTRLPSAGWLESLPRLLGSIGIIVAFGHTLLAMSGEESLAQVNRELEAPKLKNLLRAGFVIFLYSMLLTSLISFLAVAIIPDGKRVATELVLNGHTASVQGVDYRVVDFLRKGPDGHDWGYEITDYSGDYPVFAKDAQGNKVKLDLDLSQTHVERDTGGYRDNLIEGLCHYLIGPNWAKLTFAAFVVFVGFLILAGAVNTSIVGANGVFNRLAEDGVLTPGFLRPHSKFGTTYRLINIIAVLQLITIVASWGDVNTLGEAYAFGVIWSFVFKTMAMVVLRFRDKSPRQYEVPLNIRVHLKAEPSPVAVDPASHSNGNGNGHAQAADHPSMLVPADGVAPKPALHNGAAPNQIDLPIGIMLIFLILLSTAMINLVTKKTATKWGLGFTFGFLAAFVILEQISRRRRGGAHASHLEQFNEKSSEVVSPEVLGLNHPNPILVAIRNPRSLATLQRVLSETNTDKRDVVIVTCKTLPPLMQGITQQERSIDDNDRAVLTRVVTVTEEAGKQVFPLVLPTNNPLYAIATAARDLSASEVILGVSEKMNPDVQVEQFALAWGMAMADFKGQETNSLTVHILGPNMDLKYDL